MIVYGKYRIADAPGTGYQLSNIQPSSCVPTGPPGGVQVSKTANLKRRRLGVCGNCQRQRRNQNRYLYLSFSNDEERKKAGKIGDRLRMTRDDRQDPRGEGGEFAVVRAAGQKSQVDAPIPDEDFRFRFRGPSFSFGMRSRVGY